jgi:hypothetical protein
LSSTNSLVFIPLKVLCVFGVHSVLAGGVIIAVSPARADKLCEYASKKPLRVPKVHPLASSLEHIWFTKAAKGFIQGLAIAAI